MKQAHELSFAVLLEMRRNDLYVGTRYVSSIVNREVIDKCLAAYDRAIELLKAEEQNEENQGSE